jgi:putative hydrolase of the HAD superfamily
LGIKAVLFDSGRVLNQPKTGHWFIPPRFYEAVDREAFKRSGRRAVRRAFSKAYAYLDSAHHISDTEQELLQFVEYYRIFASELAELKLTEEDIGFLANDLVNNTDKYVFYEDGLRAVARLGEAGYKLAVVSDAWPSLPDAYRKAGLFERFSCFVISSCLGVTKPAAIMYETALTQLSVAPQEAVFVDDSLTNCRGAMALGIHAVLLCRDKGRYALYKILSLGSKYDVISNLDELDSIKCMKK